MSNLLAIETSAKACSVALKAGSELYESIELAERQQTRVILSQIQQLLLQNHIALNQLDAIAFASGPGSFTGIRLGASIVQGLSFGVHIPVIPIPSLQTLAQGACQDLAANQVAVAVNAFGGSVYWGLYQSGKDGLMQPLQPDSNQMPAAITLPEGDDWIGVGDGWDILAAQFSGVICYPERFPRARDVIVLAEAAFARGEALSAEKALPVYLYGAERWKKQG